MMDLGSMVGTGVFVSIGIAAGVAGPAVILAIIVAAAVATCNAMSSAQLAASHAVSGGTYEYGYRYLNPGAPFHRRLDVSLRQDGVRSDRCAEVRRIPSAAGRSGPRAYALAGRRCGRPVHDPGADRDSALEHDEYPHRLDHLVGPRLFHSFRYADNLGARRQLRPLLPAQEPGGMQAFLFPDIKRGFGWPEADIHLRKPSSDVRVRTAPHWPRANAPLRVF